MRTRTRNPFTTVSTAGLLLPVDLLTRIVDGDPSLPGLTPTDYHLRSGERLNEAASRAWNDCLAAWKSFRRKFAALSASDTGTTLTRDEWLLPLFQELGYGRLQSKRAIVIDGKEYPISHGWEDHVPIHLLSARYSVDRRTPGTAGAATRAPYSLLQELLNRSGQHRWGFVTNGLKLYLLHDNVALARAANVEFDLEAMMDGELYADFMLLFLLCHQSRVEIQPTPIAKVTLDRKAGKAKKPKAPTQKKLVTDDEAETADGDESVDANDEKPRLGPENCWLERWANQADQQGTRARDKLRDGVEAAIKSLGAGFLTTRGNRELRERMRTGELSTQDYYRQLLRVVYRLLMLLVAEEKKTENGANLFHPIGTPPEVCDRYARFYSVSRLRTLAYERRGTAHTDLYESLKVLFLKLREGYAPLGIPGMGSFLFSSDSTPDLDDAFLANQDLLDAFRHLCYTEDTSGRGGSIRRQVDFGSLGSDELGSVYESLLELHPRIDTDEGPFTLGTASGNERKTTGSYYTPTSLINCLLDSALDPVVHAAIDVPDRAEAERKLLNLKVCDPACGSGHFLIAAAERMAMHLARLRTGDDEPNTLDVQHAKRDIIGRCIYGVDINPMAVELCKVALWMEAMEPGKPFSYLDHHIQCGNSLLGTTPALLAKGIPDDAFTAIEGDDREFCSALKADNRKQRKDVERGQTGFAFDNPFPAAHLGERMMSINEAPDDSLEQIEKKRTLFKQFFSSPLWQDAYFWANYWCAAFVWKKDGGDLAKQCPTERDFRRIERVGRRALLPYVSCEVDRLSEQYQFFHWHLAYPDVFRVSDKGEAAENEHTGWSGGFDVVIGNPPWDLVTADPSGPTGDALPRIQRMFGANQYQVLSGRRDLYKLFLVQAPFLVTKAGNLGMLVPLGVFLEDESSNLRNQLFQIGTITDHRHYQNSKRSFFEHVHASYRFCHVVWSPRKVLPHRFWTVGQSPEEIVNQVAVIVPHEKIVEELGDTFSAALYDNRRYATAHQRVNNTLASGRRTTFAVKAEFHASTDKQLLCNERELETDWIILKNRNIHQFNEHFAPAEMFVRADLVKNRLIRKNLKDSAWFTSFPRLVFRDIARNDDERTLIACLAGPGRVSTYDTPMAVPDAGRDEMVLALAVYCAAFNSFLFDFLIRPYVDKHIKGYVLNRVRWPSFHAISNHFFEMRSLQCVLELTYTEWDLEPFAQECGYDGPPFCWHEQRRFQLRAELDATFFHLYLPGDANGDWLPVANESPEDLARLKESFPQPRDAVSYIMDTFPIVRRKDIAKHGAYRTKDTILEIYDAMQTAIRTGVPYQTPLNPPPGPPTDANGQFIPYAQWTSHHNTSHIHPPRVELSAADGADRAAGGEHAELPVPDHQRRKPDAGGGAD